MIFLSGGGLDSAAYIILEHERMDSVLAIDYGQQSYNAEVAATERLCEKYNLPLNKSKTYMIKNYNLGRKVSLFTGNPEDDAFVNCRNLTFVMFALQYDRNVMLGLTNPGYEPFSDIAPEFPVDTTNFLNRFFKEQNVLIEAPYVNVPRVEVFKQAYLKDNELFDLGMTCWTPIDGKECGKCKHCKLKQQQKAQVLKELGVE